MEGFHYVDIFATKGIEYIIVMVFLAGFVYFSRYLSHRAPAPAEASVPPRRFVDYFRVPDGYLFHQGHTWFRKEGREVVSVGMDDFAQKLLGRIEEVNLPHAGARVSQGEKGWTLTVDSRIVPMISPVDGEVVAVNAAALRNPAVVNEDPYGSGWLLKVKATKLAANTRNLLSGNVARRMVEESLNGIRLQSGESLGIVYQDGGVPVSGMARALYGEG
ncbi:MAG TPA: glycine cleavage system protein H, partial [Candidatus Deferrimicrobiaceae bacterium]